MYKILKLILNFPKNLTYKDPRTNKSGGQRGCWIFWPIGQRRNKRGRWYNKSKPWKSFLSMSPVPPVKLFHPSPAIHFAQGRSLHPSPRYLNRIVPRSLDRRSAAALFSTTPIHRDPIPRDFRFRWTPGNSRSFQTFFFKRRESIEWTCIYEKK